MVKRGIFQHKYQEIQKIRPEEGRQFIYEVIRVKNGSPLFLREHVERLIQSHLLVFGRELDLSSMGYGDFLREDPSGQATSYKEGAVEVASIEASSSELGISEKSLRVDCLKLIQQEKIENQNIRIEVFYQPKLQIAVFAVPSSYPSAEIVKSGVRLITVTATRDDPHAKVDPREFRKKIVTKMKKQGAFEAALVDSEGKVTEGTRSNLFFVKEIVW